MKKLEFPLSEKESAFKAEYENGGQELLKKPMMFEEYKHLSEKQKKNYDQMEGYHTNTPNGTTRDIAETGDIVEVVRHGRYSYPIMHNHMHVELVYVYSGQCVHYVEEHVIPMKEGDFCILAPSTMHATAVEDDDTIVFNLMMSRQMFDASFLKILKTGKVLSEFLNRILYKKQVSPYVLFQTGEDEWLHQTMLNVYQERKRKDYLYNESVTLYAKQIFIYLIRNYELMAIVSNPIDNSQENNIVALLGYITVNYNHITLKQVSRFFGYNEVYLGQTLQKYTGKSFNTLVTELQVENARRLLKESYMNIAEISSEVGCYDASHLTRKFKKAFGITPNEYRKQVKGRQQPVD